MKKLLLAAALLPVLIGCASGGKTIDGKWNVSDMKGLPPGSTATMTFSGGNKMVINMIMSQKKPDGKDMKMTIDINGDYTLTGDAMTFKATTADIKVDGLTDAEKKLMDPMMGGMKQQMVDEINKNSGANKLKWIDDKTIEMEGKDGKTKLTRA